MARLQIKRSTAWYQGFQPSDGNPALSEEDAAEAGRTLGGLANRLHAMWIHDVGSGLQHVCDGSRTYSAAPSSTNAVAPVLTHGK